MNKRKKVDWCCRKFARRSDIRCQKSLNGSEVMPPGLILLDRKTNPERGRNYERGAEFGCFSDFYRPFPMNWRLFIGRIISEITD